MAYRHRYQRPIIKQTPLNTKQSTRSHGSLCPVQETYD